MELIKRLIRQPTNLPEQMAGRDLLKINLSATALLWTSPPTKKRPAGRPFAVNALRARNRFS